MVVEVCIDFGVLLIEWVLLFNKGVCVLDFDVWQIVEEEICIVWIGDCYIVCCLGVIQVQ